MNKFLCDANKTRGKFKRYFCSDCTYTSRCIDYMEHTQGHNDERRYAVNDARSEAVEAVED